MVEQRQSFLPQAGLLVALGILIPFVTGHGFGMVSNILLPMHFTVLLSGFLLGPQGRPAGGCGDPHPVQPAHGHAPGFSHAARYGGRTGSLWACHRSPVAAGQRPVQLPSGNHGAGPGGPRSAHGLFHCLAGEGHRAFPCCSSWSRASPARCCSWCFCL